MATEIKTWEIVDGELKSVNSTLADEGRKEKEHLEAWIRSNTKILGADILIIGEQVQTKSGPLDFLGIDNEGNLIVVELKRDKLPREALAQAIDYASAISTWGAEKISEICHRYTGKSLEDYFAEHFETDSDELSVNNSQRLLLVGFGVEESLNRMIEWLSQNFDISINAIILNYTRTSSGSEILSRTVIVPEEVEKEKSGRRKRTKSIISRLLEQGKIKEGDLFIYQPALDQGYDKTDDRIRATLVNRHSSRSCLQRKVDDQPYSFSRVRYNILTELDLSGIRKDWGFGIRSEWVTEEGKKLVDLLNE